MKKNKLVFTSCVLATAFGLCACGGSSSSTTSTSSSSTSSSPVCVEDNKIHLILLAGQSGARGKALNRELSEEQKVENLDVDIIADGFTMPQLSNIPNGLSSSATLKVLKPGFGDSGNEFGPELGMGETLASRFPKDGDARKSVIVKYTASGSTFTNHWYSSSAIEDETISDKLVLNQIQENPKTKDAMGPLTNNFFQLIDFTIAELEADGYEVVIDGAAFLHGEQDAKFDANMDIYQTALTHFIQDLRTYVGDETLPFVLPEALTNSAKYSNTLRSIQKEVAAKTTNVSFLSHQDLYPNTFEPWHIGPQSNFVLGNRIAAEIVSYNDNRKVKSFDPLTIRVPKGVTIALPTYVTAEFENGYKGMIKVTYPETYSSAETGLKLVKFEAKTNCGTYQGTINVEVTNDPYIDGVVNEYATTKANPIGEMGSVYVKKATDGLFVSAKIQDDEIWTDGEAWEVGDMGQDGKNDDFRIYLTTSTADQHYSILLSAANLLRIYGPGVNLSTSALQKSNLVYTQAISEFAYRVHTKGLMNVEGEKVSETMEVEFYISYAELEIENPDDIKLCFAYNNISSTAGKKTAKDTYLVHANANVATGYENSDASYISIADLV